MVVHHFHEHKGNKHIEVHIFLKPKLSLNTFLTLALLFKIIFSPSVATKELMFQDVFWEE